MRILIGLVLLRVCLLSGWLSLVSQAHAANPSHGTDLGWEVAEAPHGRLLPWRLTGVREDSLLAEKGHAALYAIGQDAGDYHPENTSVVFIHGLDAGPEELLSLIERFRAADVQSYVLLYDDFFRRTARNGEDLADELRSLNRSLRGNGRNITLIAHSMGGIVARVAMNTLVQRNVQDEFRLLHLLAIDTPWHGYIGPCDTGVSGFFMNVSRAFMPDGLEDMRACSRLFVGSAATAERRSADGLNSLSLPDHFAVRLLFAQERGVVLRWDEGPLAPLASRLVALYRNDIPVRGGVRLMNVWRALLSSEQYFGFQEEMRQLADEGALDEVRALRVLRKHFPSFAGDHNSVLQAKAGGLGVGDYLLAQLRSPSPTTMPAGPSVALASR
ncbi:MAG TPA: hypothetical protein PKI03_01600 [Pseudomonadota bacterium]|nr:hypothetical protein [Pseudomonadota bacterium]